VQPELGIAEENLATERTEDAIAIGEDHVIRVKVTGVSRRTASIVACVDGGEIFVNAMTRQPIPGGLGQPGIEGSKAVMLLTPAGWKLETQEVTVGRCPQS
jgi:hypothetical protein